VSFQVLDPPLGSFESLRLRSWPRVCVNLGLCFLFIMFYALKKKNNLLLLFFLFKHLKKNQKQFLHVVMHLVW
jgi:hypothetical protein